MSFDSLPTEIILRIIEYIPPEEVALLIYVNLRFQKILTKFPVRGTLNLERSHLLSVKDIKQFFYKNTLALGIKTLVLNGLWWFDPVKQIVSCKNVLVLHMVDVKLTTLQFTNILSSCTKVKDIAFSWPKDLTLENISDLKHCEGVLMNMEKLKFLTSGPYVNLKFLRLTPNIRKLEIITDLYSLNGGMVATSAFSDYAKAENSLGNLKFNQLQQVKIVTTPISYLCCIYDRLQVHLVGSHNSSRLSYELLCSYSDFRPMGNLLKDVSWFADCEVLKFSMSEGLEDQIHNMTFPNTKELFLFGQCQNPVTDLVAKMPRLQSLHFFAECPIPLNLGILRKQHPGLKKLSFRCFKESHSLSYVLEELEGFTELTHLCIPPCVLEAKLPSTVPKKSFVQIFIFKRPRVGELKANEKAGEAAFNKVLENCPLLQVLEIARFEEDYSLQWYERFCRRPPVHWHCVENIKKLPHLTHLTIEFIPVTSGAFLHRIAEGCQKLEFLRLKDLGPRGKCVYLRELSEALPSFKNLCSFRLEDNYLLPGNPLFGALKRCSKLERVVVFSVKEDSSLHQESLINLLQTKKSLTFAYFNFNGIPASAIARVIKEVKPKKSRCLYMCILNRRCKEPDRNIPLKHSREMLQFMPWIAV